MDIDNLQAAPVRTKDWVSYRCQRCGQCCRHIKNSIMLESLDAYRLAGFLQERGEAITDISDVFSQYSLPMSLTDDGFPVFLLRTLGPEDTCVFLQNGSCSIYPVRPRTCRLYPFGVAPGERGKDFEYYICMDKTHHLSGGRVSVNDWLYNNFKRDDREFVKLEFQHAAEIGKVLRRLPGSIKEKAIFPLMYFRYYNYDLQEPFMQQYELNHRQLLNELNKLEQNR